tara:strand:- start:10937 stop:11608 length:672 start_codon:yes stop_codon:yes gene_type:complete
MKNILYSLLFLIGCVSLSISQNIDNFCGWNYNLTSGSSTIAILSTENFELYSNQFENSISVSEITCPVLIGVFYTGENDQLFCGGYTTWNNSSNFSIAGWADDSTTPIKDGFSSGESYTFQLCIEGYGELLFNAVMNENPPFLHNNFATNGLSGLSSSVTFVDDDLFTFLSNNCSLINNIEYSKKSDILLKTDLYGRTIDCEKYKGFMIEFYKNNSYQKIYKF